MSKEIDEAMERWVSGAYESYYRESQILQRFLGSPIVDQYGRKFQKETTASDCKDDE
jgi:hypothetical protein